MKTIVSLVGMKYRGTEELVASLPADEPLTIVRDPRNKFDPKAIQVWARGVHLGFLKAGPEHNAPIAAMMDRRRLKEMHAQLAITPDRWPMVEIDQPEEDIG